MLLNFKKTLNSNIEQNEKLKAKDTEIQKTTTEKRKPSSTKRKCKKCRLIDTRTEQSNNHTQIIQKI